MSSELTSYGTGWSETEALLDVVEVYDSWDGKSQPDFSPVQRRLRERFEDNELLTLETIVNTFAQFIAAELQRRTDEKAKSAQENETQ